MFSKAQRVALWNLCTIQNLTFYEPEMRTAALGLRELIQSNTLDIKHNLCSFDCDDEGRLLPYLQEKKKVTHPVRSSSKNAKA